MRILANTVVELPEGTVVNVASTVTSVRLLGRSLAKMSTDEDYASLGEPAGGFLHGAYMDLLQDVEGRSEDGSLVSLGRGTSVFVVPGTVVALVSKASADKESCSSGLGWTLVAGFVGLILGAAIGGSGR